MSKIFINQTKLVIRLDLSASITGYDACVIKYTKPNGVKGEFVASVENEEAGIISYIVQSENDIDQSGQWVFWGYVTFLDGKAIAGESTRVIVFRQGQDV